MSLGMAAAIVLAQSVPHVWMILPFVLLLVCLAIMPVVAAPWWARHYAEVALGLGAVTVLYYVLAVNNGTARLLHVGHEYLSFIALIGSLFIVTGGIHVGVQGEARPSINCVFLLIGALLANLIGTTGASMVLIRPWIRMNKYRITAFHVVFFIFIISNVGGCLTPIGDPPLFLGYLKGVPFWWTVQTCWLPWIVAIGLLLITFYIFDTGNFLRAPAAIRKKETAEEKWTFKGLVNLLWLAVILAAVFVQRPAGLREALMASAGLASYFLTPKPIHEANDFNFHPIREVAWIFAGIFATMMPALDYISGHAAGLGLNSPSALYWMSGGLSAVLDNAPTYLTFLAGALGSQHLEIDRVADVQRFAAEHSLELRAISLGAVFFGAMTYIGNGPNFMVKAICDHAKIKTPGFGGYLFWFALPLLLPVLAVVWWLFVSPWRPL